MMARASVKKTPKVSVAGELSKRKYLSQGDVPAYSLSRAIQIPQAIANNYGKNPTKPLRVAEAMGMSPGASGFRMLCGAALAYGLTDGGYNSELIGITPLGRRIVSPTAEGDDICAKIEAFLRPRVVRDFLTRYNGSRFPTEMIARNVLDEIGVPTNKTKDVFALIAEGAKELALLRGVKGQTYVDLDGTARSVGRNDDDSSGNDDAAEPRSDVPTNETKPGGSGGEGSDKSRRHSGRVFITHGRNREVVTQLKDLLTFGGFTPVVAIEQETVSKPVPDKVLDDMRSCDAAIIHIGTELRLVDSEGKEHKMLNQNVLIEIGAAMGLYGRKFILLVEKGATLPSNLQGLYEVRYEGEKLDYESTMKLLRAFNDFRG
jgi:Predicted nucleotide-binding protein containing TIR-like domain